MSRVIGAIILVLASVGALMLSTPVMAGTDQLLSNLTSFLRTFFFLSILLGFAVSLSQLVSVIFGPTRRMAAVLVAVVIDLTALAIVVFPLQVWSWTFLIAGAGLSLASTSSPYQERWGGLRTEISWF